MGTLLHPCTDNCSTQPETWRCFAIPVSIDSDFGSIASKPPARCLIELTGLLTTFRRSIHYNQNTCADVNQSAPTELRRFLWEETVMRADVIDKSTGNTIHVPGDAIDLSNPSVVRLDIDRSQVAS